jgi:hypothetical protein
MLIQRNYDRYYDFTCEGSAVRIARTAHNSMTDNKMRKPGLEPGRVTPLDPKSSASTNSATSAGWSSWKYAPVDRGRHLRRLVSPS